MISFDKKNKKSFEDKDINAKHIVAKSVMIFAGIFILLYVLSFVIIISWTLNNSIKGDRLFVKKPFALFDVNDIRWENYSVAFNKLTSSKFFPDLNRYVYFNYWKMFLNSFLFAAGTAAMGIIMNFLVAYPLGRYNFPGKSFLYNMAILLMIIPVVGNMSSSLYVRRVLGIYDNMFLHIITASGGFGLNFMLIYGAVKAVAGSYVDAAKIDGAGHFTVMMRICLPMVFPLMFCLFMISFTGHWNDYSTILIYLPSSPNLAYGLHLFRSTATTGNGIIDPQVLAAYVLVAIPSTVFWCIGQRFVLENYTVGGLKE